MMNKKDENIEDIVFEDDDIQDAQVVKKLRNKLRNCEKEKKEYLDGWQRSKAELLNSKKEASEKLSRFGQTSKDALAAELLPVLDSFDMAFKGESWGRVDEVWQKGVEYIHTQLLGVLAAHGVEQFGKIGEQFDPKIHEASEEVADKKVISNTITTVLNPGYKTKSSVIRPARVIVAK